MKGVYLCSRKHRINGFDIDYNDIEPYEGINLLCDCRNVDLANYDFIIATPPCNYWSHANYRRETSIVSKQTKDLLPYCLKACIELKKPFLIENVCNEPLFIKEFGDLYKKCICFTFGNHTFWTNVLFWFPPEEDAVFQNKQYVTRSKRDNNYNVHHVIDLFLEVLKICDEEGSR